MLEKLFEIVNGIEVVDLGLPSGTLWARCNFGTECETDYGEYYQFGCFEPYKETKDNFNLFEFGSINGFTVPTKEQFRELLENTEHMWTTINGVRGYKFTSKVDETKYVFFPPAGICFDGSVRHVGSYGNYWSSSLYSSDFRDAYRLFFDSGAVNWHYIGTRRVGCSLRLVLNKNDK